MRLNTTSPPETVVFNGVEYKRMGGKRRYYLSRGRTRAEKMGAKGLHVAIWEYFAGCRVPTGHEIHHKDGDTFNCSFENLECLPIGAHRRMPKRVDKEARRALLERIRPLASLWHRSPEGRAWHKEHARYSLHKPGRKKPFQTVLGTRECEWCGRSFEYRNPRNILCSARCQWEKARRARKARKGL